METEEKKTEEAVVEPVSEPEKKTPRFKCVLQSKKRVAVGIILVLALIGVGYYQFVWTKHNISESAAKQKVEDFINNNLVQSGSKVTVAEIKKEGGMFEVKVKVGEGKQQQEIVSYLSADGKKFFPSVMEIAKVEKEMAEAKVAGEEKAVDVPKTDKPSVELFVMSYCPYGTQIEKGILPVLDTLGAKIEYKLKFVDYAMHDKKEIDENLKQYCIQKNEPTKLSPYLKCFLKDDKKAAECLRTVGVNTVKLNSCVAATDKEFEITKKYGDKSAWSNGSFPPFDVDKADNQKYGVKGSPTLVVNGVDVPSGRDSASLLKAICSGFNTQPKECEATLSSASPSPGFGEGTASASSADAGCAN